MKKILPFLMAILLILCVGCRKNFDNGVFSSLSSDSMSGAEYFYNNGCSEIDSVVSAVESDIKEMENAGDVTVSRETYIDESSDESTGDAGKQSAVIDSTIDSADAAKIEEADVNTRGTKPLYYNYLTDTQRQIYRFMKSAADAMTEGLFSIGAVSGKDNNRFNDITMAFRAMSGDNPQLFWLPATYVISPDGSAVAFSYHKNGYNIDYNIKSDSIETEKKRFYNTLSSLVSEANKLDSRFKKELYFHDWLCENVTYGTDGTQNSYTAYGALINGTAVCEGYSRAMQLLCDSVSIPCTVVYGNSNGVGHMWNIIDPGDGWYNLDVTWDDDEQYGVVRHSYFNVSNAVIKTDHTIFEAAKPNRSYSGSDFFNIYLYDCSSMSYNYFVKNNLIFTDDTAHNVKLVTDALQNGKTQVELMYKNSNGDYKTALNQLNGELYKQGVFVNMYSDLGSALVLWLTFIR